MELETLVKVRILELKDLRDYWSKEVEAEPRLHSRKRALEAIEELLRLNCNILEGLQNEKTIH